MARRQRDAADAVPAVPRWCVEHVPGQWASVSEWRSAVSRWARPNLYGRGEFEAWIELLANSYRVLAERGEPNVAPVEAHPCGKWNDSLLHTVETRNL